MMSGNDEIDHNSTKTSEDVIHLPTGGITSSNGNAVAEITAKDQNNHSNSKTNGDGGHEQNVSSAKTTATNLHNRSSQQPAVLNTTKPTNWVQFDSEDTSEVCGNYAHSHLLYIQIRDVLEPRAYFVFLYYKY